MSIVDNETTLAKVKKESFFKTEEYEDAIEIIEVHPLKAAEAFERILASTQDTPSDILKYANMKEECVYLLARIYSAHHDEAGLNRVMKLLREFFPTITKPRSAKILRGFLDEASSVDGAEAILIPICLNAIKWAEEEKRTFLRQRIQVRLVSLYITASRLRDALALLHTLSREIRKLDDKPLLVEISLLEAKAHIALENVPRAKSALTAARANANAFYCPALLQADLDAQAGEISAAEGDFKTAYSYFYEAFEAYSSQASLTANKPKIKTTTTTKSGNPTIVSSKEQLESSSTHLAAVSLQRMILCKIMSGHAGDVHAIITSRAALPFINVGHGIEALEALVLAQRERSISELEKVLHNYSDILKDDRFFNSQINHLRDTMLEFNILRVCEPYSCVEISRLAKLVGLDVSQIETKVAEMILDKKISGVLDQETGDLILTPDQPEEKLIHKSISVIEGLENVLDKLHEKMNMTV